MLGKFFYFIFLGLVELCFGQDIYTVPASFPWWKNDTAAYNSVVGSATGLLAPATFVLKRWDYALLECLGVGFNPGA